MARICVSAGCQDKNLITDAVGPDTYTFNELVPLIAHTVGSKAKIIHLPPRLVHVLAKMVGYVLNDVVLTGDEIKGLMSNLLSSVGHSTGQTRLSGWLEQNASNIGIHYSSELKRHYCSHGA